MSIKPLVHIIILNWNNYRDTIECVTACQQLDYSNARILILDNGSKNDSVMRLTECFPEIEIIETGTNCGYAAGNNIGIRQAIDNGSEYIWILNPDVVVERGTLSVLVGVMEDNPSIGICGPRIIHGKEPSRFAFDGISVESDKGYQWQFNVIDRQPERIQPFLVDVDGVSGCSMLVRNDLFRSIGYFSEDFFLYYEDVEISFRARDHGWRTVVCTGVSVMHDRDVFFKKQAIGFRTERSRIILARLRKDCTLKNLITSQSVDIVKSSIKQFRLLQTFKLITEIFLGILSGLLKPAGVKSGR